MNDSPAKIARIDEAQCIGCTQCLQVCPVDAIFGAAKHMHTVLANECIGCNLCVPACPVDCITLLPTGHLHPAARQARAQRARLRVQARRLRLHAQATRLASAGKDKKAEISAAIARTQAKKDENSRSA